MPLGFRCLHDPQSGALSSDQLIDIVAVHDVHEDSLEAWTDPKSGANWLRDFLPEDIGVARILTYGYDASASALFASDASETIQGMAESFVQELRANRKLAGTLRRPLIFVCHGLGGVLVKKSLVYSSTRTAPKVDHLWDQFISTFAIVFFGTPHGDVAKSNWLELEATARKYPRVAMNTSSAGNTRSTTSDKGVIQIPRLVHHEFSPLVRHFNLFFFWEQLPTPLGTHVDFLVEHRSAVPMLDNTEVAGIHANHIDMTKFRSRSSSDYRTVLAALDTYCEKAPDVISRRWKLAERRLQDLRRGEAEEIGGFGFDIRSEEPFQSPGIRPRGQLHFHLPDDATPNFVGRQDALSTIHNAFFPDDRPSTTPGRKSFIVFGMGGSGKTELCCKFATEYKDQYTAVFTIRASSPKTIKESYCDIGRLAGLEPTESAGKHFLSQQEDCWLLIIDNADDPSQSLRRLFPQCGTAHVLVTTRVRSFGQEGTLGKLELKGLAEPDALQLLLTKAEIPRPWAASVTEVGIRIAQTLGYLALALIQAGTCVYEGVCELGEYLEIYSTSRQGPGLHRNASPSLPSDTAEDGTDAEVVESVYSAFNVSLGHMKKKVSRESRDAADLLKIIAFYHFERIPLAIFHRAASTREKAITEAHSRQGWMVGLLRRLEPPLLLPAFLKEEVKGRFDKHRINYAVAELQSLSFVRSDGKYISLHPLTHSWARHTLTATQEHLWSSIALQTLMESVSLPPESSTEADGDFHRDVVQHLDNCLSVTGNPISPSVMALSKLRMQIDAVLQPTLLLIYSAQVRIHAKCGWVFAERGRFETAADHLDIVRSMLTKMVGPDDERTLTATLGLAGVYWGLVKLDDTITLIRSVVEARTRIYGPKSERTLQAMGKLASALWLHGYHQEALRLQEATWAHMKEVLGESHPETLATLDQLGVTLGSFHRFNESLTAHQFVLDVRSQTLGDVHPQTLETKSNLAMVLLDLGDAAAAKKIMTDVFGQRQLQLGKEHPWTLWALCYLAKIDIELGLLNEAEEMLTWGIEAALRSLQEDHLGVLMARGVLAQIYARTNRLDLAETLTRKIITQVESARGIAHPDTVYALWRLARLYVRRQDRESAIVACHTGLERADMRITREHPIARDIAALLERLKDPSWALKVEDLQPEKQRPEVGVPGQPPSVNVDGKQLAKASLLGLRNRLTKPERILTW
ncbi:hypothetical protein B0T16DRAFT_392425 [Cercophora newfieldiana]|uniref:Uncharacterized protein n=1 Tax=Cercophora newfieldiana TaxID=92897 RepID=A0AA39Y1E5_9PEZI|nr:hypothetical protein B0T16DRAFT_392425 [Cercophora newfieldiana]